MALEQQQIIALLSRIHFFHGLNPEKLAIAASFLEEVHYVAEKFVFEQTEDAPLFFFVYSGRLQMTRFSKATQTEEMLGFLDEGDYFGQELIDGSDRQVSVQAITEVTLLSLDGAALSPNDWPAPRIERPPAHHRRYLPAHAAHAFELGESRKSTFTIFPSRHSIFLLGRLAPVLLVLVLLVGTLLGAYAIMQLMIFLILTISFAIFGLAVMGWQYIDWSNDYFIITGRRVVYQEKIVLLYDSRQESPIDHVRATETDTSQLGRILGYGTLRIRTLTGIIHFQGIQEPAEVDAIVQEQVKRTQSSLRQAELKAIEEFHRAQDRAYTAPARRHHPRNRTNKKSRPAAFNASCPIYFTCATNLVTRSNTAPIGGCCSRASGSNRRSYWGSSDWRSGCRSTTSAGMLGESFPLIGAFLGLCLAGFDLCLWWLYIYVDWHNDLYLITNDQVVDIYRKPLGTEENQAAQIRNILSVEYKRIGHHRADLQLRHGIHSGR